MGEKKNTLERRFKKYPFLRAGAGGWEGEALPLRLPQAADALGGGEVVLPQHLDGLSQVLGAYM